MSSDGSASPDASHYSFKVSLVGAPSEFRLGDSDMECRSGSRVLRVAYRDIQQVRLVFRPVTLQNFRFVTEIMARRGPKTTIASTSWRSMVEHERLDRPYKAFIAELHQRIAASGANVIYRTGAPALLYWPGLAIFAGLMIATTILAFRAVQIGEWRGAAFIAVMLGFFLWQAGSFFRRNRPGTYTPDKLPNHVLP